MARELLVAVFPTRNQLVQALAHIKTLGSVDIKRVAIVSINHDGETVVVDDDLSAAEGGPAGMVLGGVLAAGGMVILGATRLPGVGPVLAIVVGTLIGAIIGRLTGRFAANLLDFGFPRAVTNDIATQLQPGQPALLVETARADSVLPTLETAFAAYEAQTVQRLEDDGN